MFPVHRTVGRSLEIHLRIFPNFRKFFSSEICLSEDGKKELPLPFTESPCTSNIATDKAELVKNLLRDYGFTNTHISKLVAMRPQILSSSPQKTLLPKLEFFRSIGLLGADLPRVICANDSLLHRSLEKQLIPCYNFLKSVLVLDENVVKMLKRSSRILKSSIEKNIAPNIIALRGAGAPRSILMFMLFRSPSTLTHDSNKFKESVHKAIEMGFNPSRTTFVLAVRVLCEMRDETWEHKFDVFRRWGLSDDEILVAFRSHPLCMYISEGKIMETMDFLVEKMGWQAAAVARYPPVLFYNLEKRIIPRCRVMKILLENGLVKKRLSLSTFLVPGEKSFLDKFVKRYQDDVAGLMNIYSGKTDLLEAKLGSKT